MQAYSKLELVNSAVKYRTWEILGPHSCAAEDWYFLGCDAVLLDE
jgi:hypothetical protein